MKRTLLSLVCLMLSLMSFAHDFEVDGICYNVTSQSNLTCEVTTRDNQIKCYSGDITIPAQVSYSGKVYNVTAIGDMAFMYCSKLTTIVISDGVTSIGKVAFYYCTKLSSVTIPNSVTSIGESAFDCCISLASVVIPNSVTSIGKAAFNQCYAVTSINIPETMTTIEDHVFERCFALTSVTIPNSIKSIGSSAFEGCSKLSSITIPNSVTNIGMAAFRDCGLTSIIIPDSVERIEQATFENCSHLTSVTIGTAVQHIDILAFDRDLYLMEIVCLPTIPPTCTSETFSSSTTWNAIVRVPDESVSAYKEAEIWKRFKNIVALSDENTGINNSNKKNALLLRSNGNSITVDGLEEGEMLELYNVNGMMLDKVTSSGTSATLGSGLQKNQIYIIKAGNRSIKYKF